MREPLCRAERGRTMTYCTRPEGHDGAHIATIGPWTPEKAVIATWPNTPAPTNAGDPNAQPRET